MKTWSLLPALGVCGLLAMGTTSARAQAPALPGGEAVVISPPPVIVPGGSFIVKERRHLFRPRARVYVMKPRSGRIRVPATTAVVESVPRTTITESPSTLVEAPSPIVEAPATVIEPPARLEELRPAAPDLEKPEPDSEVRYVKPAAVSTPRPAVIIRSTPR